MSVRLIFTPFAELDLLEIKSWYSIDDKDLYVKFIDEFEYIINLLLSDPKSFPIIFRKYRKATMKKFPYKIIYSFDLKSVIIIAIIHHKRHTKIWKSRTI